VAGSGAVDRALCWSAFRGTRHGVSLYDAFVPGVRSLSATQYERPADAVRDGRQLRWERQALRLLDSDQVTWRQLRHDLYASAPIDSDLDYEAADWSQTKEGLRDWLIAHLISLRRSTSPAPPAGGAMARTPSRNGRMQIPKTVTGFHVIESHRLRVSRGHHILTSCVRE
jgi:hypothetical protein